MPADGVIVIGAEQATQGGAEAEHREVRPGDEHALAAQGFVAEREIGADGAMRRDPRQHGLALFQIPIHRIAEDDRAAAGLAAALRAGVRSLRMDVDEL